MRALLLALAWAGLMAPAGAVEVAPRISDREIIEALAELKAGQKAMEQRFDAIDQRFESIDKRFADIDRRFAAIDKRFADIDKRFEAIDQRFDGIEQRLTAIEQRFATVDQRFEAMDTRFAAIDKRLDDLNRRIDDLWNITLVLVAGIFGLIGFVVWDRKTALRPLEHRLIRLEQEVRDDIEAHRGQGDELRRLLEALRALAREDERFARALREQALL